MAPTAPHPALSSLYTYLVCRPVTSTFHSHLPEEHCVPGPVTALAVCSPHPMSPSWAPGEGSPQMANSFVHPDACLPGSSGGLASATKGCKTAGQAVSQRLQGARRGVGLEGALTLVRNPTPSPKADKWKSYSRGKNLLESPCSILVVIKALVQIYWWRSFNCNTVEW